MTKLQELDKKFQSENPSKGMQYSYTNHDFSEIQLDGYYTSTELRRLADKLDEYNKLAYEN